jgi:integral membrane protein
VTKLFTAYRVLAVAVGVLLLAASIDWLLHQISGSVPDLWWLWMLHGYVYMAYLVVAVPFTRKAGWPLKFVGHIIVAGLIPVLMFFVEHYVAERYKREHPELFGAAGEPA